MDDLDEPLTYGTDAHAEDPDEDPMDHLGEEIADPWEGPRQEDWATTTLDLSEVG